MFVSPLAWIRNTGGLVNPRLEKMICCRIEEQPCTAHISYGVCAHLLCMIHVSALLDFPWNATGFFFFSYSPTFSAACNISCCNIYYPTTRPARPACLSFPQSPHHQLPAHLPLISPIISWFIFRTDNALQLHLLSLKPLSVSLSGFLHPNCAIKPSGNPQGWKKLNQGQTEVP